MVPTIVTERLVLRGHDLADLDALCAMWADPAVVRDLGGVPRGREDTWARFLRFVGHWALLGYGTWAIAERATGAYVGAAGIARFERDISEVVVGDHEASWVLAAAAHGKGYASEAMRAALAWFDAAVPATPTACIIRAANAGSLRLAAKLGYVEAGRGTHHGSAVTVFRRPPPAVVG